MDIKLEPVKDWEELGLSNDFLFGKIMSKPELCKQMLETIPDIEIERIEYPEAQKSIIEEKDAREDELMANWRLLSEGDGYFKIDSLK